MILKNLYLVYVSTHWGLKFKQLLKTRANYGRYNIIGILRLNVFNSEHVLCRFKGEAPDNTIFKSESRILKSVGMTKYETYEKYAKTYATQSTP